MLLLPLMFPAIPAETPEFAPPVLMHLATRLSSHTPTMPPETTFPLPAPSTVIAPVVLALSSIVQLLQDPAIPPLATPVPSSSSRDPDGACVNGVPDGAVPTAAPVDPAQQTPPCRYWARRHWHWKQRSQQHRDCCCRSTGRHQTHSRCGLCLDSRGLCLSCCFSSCCCCCSSQQGNSSRRRCSSQWRLSHTQPQRGPRGSSMT